MPSSAKFRIRKLYLFTATMSRSRSLGFSTLVLVFTSLLSLEHSVAYGYDEPFVPQTEVFQTVPGALYLYPSAIDCKIPIDGATFQNRQKDLGGFQLIKSIPYGAHDQFSEREESKNFYLEYSSGRIAGLRDPSTTITVSFEVARENDLTTYTISSASTQIQSVRKESPIQFWLVSRLRP